MATNTGFVPAGTRFEVGSPGWIGLEKDLLFLGILNGLATIGHSVWIFDAAAEIGIACGDADIVVIDSAVLERLESSL